MQAVNPAITACYMPAVKLLQMLNTDFSEMRLNYRLPTYSKFCLMTVDKICYPPSTKEESSLIFKFVSSDNSRASGILYILRVPYPRILESAHT